MIFGLEDKESFINLCKVSIMAIARDGLISFNLRLNKSSNIYCENCCGSGDYIL